MIPLLRIALEAHNEERNHHRRYELAVGRDLLGDWVVILTYGRIGKGQQRRQFSSPDREAARRFARERLRRRLSAPRRIGCAYAVCHAEDSEFVAIQDWVPEDLSKS